MVTSGLAATDGVAHRGALRLGQTVVLGTGLQCLYPQRHAGPAVDDIVAAGGALASELPLDCPPQAANFPRRNRLISGLSLAGVAGRGFALQWFAGLRPAWAAEQGREVWALPRFDSSSGAMVATS